MDPDGSWNPRYRPPPLSCFTSGDEPVVLAPPPITAEFRTPPSFPFPAASPFIEPPPFSPFLSFESFEAEFESKPVLGNEPGGDAGGGESLVSAPQPLESLYETPVPPFLSKTFDLVDDTSLDAIIGWGARGDSFVVWNPVEFARVILPRNFKHNNFSSFVRQLNTYGFRKIDTDKWEFANEGFVRGQRHLLKNIQRRKSPHPQNIGSSSALSDEAGKAELGGEIELLRKERNLMMQEMVELQHQQRGTVKHMEMVNEKLQTAEKRQKQMVSFLGKIFQNPAFLTCFQQMRQQKSITSPRAMRKFVKHHMHESGTSDLSPKGQIVSFQHELGDPFTPKQLPGPPLQDMMGDAPFEVEDTSLSEYALMDEFLSGPEHGEAVDKGKGVVAGPEFLISFPEDLVKEEKTTPEFPISGTQSMAVEDGLWSAGFGASAGMSSSTELWGDVSCYDVPELDSLSDVWNISSLQRAGSSGMDKWLNQDSPFSELDKQEGRRRDDSSNKLDP